MSLPNRQDLPDNTIDIQRQEDEITNKGRDKCFEVKKNCSNCWLVYTGRLNDLTKFALLSTMLCYFYKSTLI